MNDQLVLTPTLSDVRPVVLSLLSADRPPTWMASTSLHQNFLIVQVRDRSSAAELARRCRPDLLLDEVQCDGRLFPGPDQGVPTCSSRGLPVVLVQTTNSPSSLPITLKPDVADVLSADLASEVAAIRLRAVLRRERPVALRSRISWKNLELRHDQRTVVVAGEVTHLSFQQFNLLALLLEEPGQVWPRQELQRAVWGVQVEVGAKALNRQVQLVRHCLTPRLGYDPIEAMRGCGYRIR